MAKTNFLVYGLMLLSLSGCVATRNEVAPPTPACGSEQGIIFSADGAGGFRATSVSLSQAIFREKLPLRVEPVDWSHGWGRVYCDETDYVHAQCEGRRLAERIVAYRQTSPDGDIYLVGHSAGCAVVVAAAEAAPAGVVNRVILLAPALSADYDLRPALRNVRCGIDVFCSERDWFFLGLGTTIIGTVDRHWGSAGGRVGFRPTITTAEDMALYCKLQQHPWHPCLAWTGNLGGHYGGYQPNFLHTYVLPLFQPSPRPAATCAAPPACQKINKPI
jgi:pimeloyl-ACP methyl ester carboxylesterase